MKNLSRRDVLRRASQATAYGAVLFASRNARPADANAPESALCLSMFYPGAKGRFDADRFRDKHLPLIRGIYGDSVERIELRVPPAQDRRAINTRAAPPPPFLAVVNLWIHRLDEYARHTAESAQEVQADLRKVSEVVPYVQYDQALSHTGSARTAVPVGTEVACTFFPNKDGGRWDGKYVAETYMPKVIDLYGADALLRTEVTQGRTGQNGVKSTFIGATHLYIRDRPAFDVAGRKAMSLFQEAPRYTDIMGLFTFLRVYAAG